ncbi:cation acetate symporter [Fodinisporobacter ferrooxydans]|uniref:Cation acetate symporter n=1 Tax=Fodinisporobacter ferrooxydans TaxID=2901836 RepID=A0ABY4CQ68_9BACL|nr:cation acetate symporter [Alicyclobacillaceae bacterium MYW30-H2]
MNSAYFIFFAAILIGSLVISYWSAKRGTSTHHFYTAAGSLTGLQNGLAIAGDYLSAASFLGITGAVALHGYDGFLYSIGFLVSYLLLLLFAEPIRHLGTFTLADVICVRFPSGKIRMIISLNTMAISILYMVPQLVAVGLLVHLLLGVHYTVSVLVTGTLMILYVVFGGMVSASWVQIVKTVLLLTGTFLVSLMVLARFHWDLFSLLEQVKTATPYKEQFFAPGNMFSNPLEMLSLNFSLVLGTAGLPHILNRFFTVKDARAVRKSIVTATIVIGVFYLITLILGLGAVALVGWDRLVAIDPSGNLAAPLLGAAVGGNFFMAFISAIAFTTILAVVTGLLLSATSSFSHDIYNVILLKGQATEKKQLIAAKLTAVVIGFAAVLVSLDIQHSNAVFPVSLTFVVAASTNLPLILFTLYWKRFNSTGAFTGIITGLIASLALVFWGSHSMFLNNFNPGIIAIPLGFLGFVFGTLCSRQPVDENRYLHVWIRSQTGINPEQL